MAPRTPRRAVATALACLSAWSLVVAPVLPAQAAINAPVYPSMLPLFSGPCGTATAGTATFNCNALLGGNNTWGGLNQWGTYSLWYDGGSQTYKAGIGTAANAQLINFGINDGIYGTPVASAQGGYFRVDGRTAYPLFDWFGLSSAGNAGASNAIMTLDPRASMGLAIDGSIAPGPAENSNRLATTSMVQQHLSRVVNMAAVAGWANTAFPVEVDGTTLPGDGGRRRMVFDSANLCGAGGHPAADGYTCVNSTIVATGSWNIDWGSVNFTANPVLYGAKFLGGPTSSADTAALQAALSSGQKKVRVPALGGNLVLSACLNITLNGQLIDFDDVGNGAGLSVNVGTNLQTSQVPNCRGIITYAAGLTTNLTGLAINFGQPDTTSAASLYTYPPAIYDQTSGRSRFSHILCSNATICIDARQNSGGIVIDDIKYNAYQYGIWFDGSEDTNRVIEPHWYPFNMTANQANLFEHSSAAAIYSGRMDDLEVDRGLFFGGVGISTYTGSISNLAGPTFGSITNTDFDTFSGIAMQSGDLSCASCIFNVGDAVGVAVNLSGSGRLVCAACNIGMGVQTSNPLIVVAGNGTGGTPQFVWAGGVGSYLGFFDQSFAQIGGSSLVGSATISSVRFQWPTQTNKAKSTPIVQTASTGRLTAIGNTMGDYGTGGGTFIAIGGENYNRIIGNSAPGWGYSFPAAPTVGVYQFN